MAEEVKVSWDQVLTWRMRRHLLDQPARLPATHVARRLCGVQAQVASAAKLAVAVRQADPVRGEIDQALADRDLVKTWAMRGTLHLLNPDEAGCYLSLMAATRWWEKPSWQKASGLSPAEVAALTEAVAEALDGRVLTREELVAEVAAHSSNPHLEPLLRSGWGSVLKPVAWQGQLCHGPSQGNRVTFARPDAYLPTWGGVPEPEQAAQVVIPAYLRAYGPATMAAFDTWLTRGASKKAALRGWFAALGDRLVTVDVEGEPGYLLAEDVADLAGTEPVATVRLLPGFDQYVLGPGTNAAQVIAPARRPDVSRTAGWIAPVLVVGGRVAGVWEIDGTELRITVFEESDEVDPAALESEAGRIAAFLDTPLTVSVGSS